MNIMGLDTSTKTGFSILDDKGQELEVGVISYPAEADRFARFNKYVFEVIRLVKLHKIDLVVIEGYSYAGKFNNSIQYELGACIRMELYRKGVSFLEVPPTSLKKFVTGKGQCKKDLMLLNVYKRWQFDTDDDNIADAYGLSMFGRAFLGYDAKVPGVNMSAVEKIHKSDQPFCKQFKKPLTN